MMENEMMFQLLKKIMMEPEINEHATEKPLEELRFSQQFSGLTPPAWQ